MIALAEMLVEPARQAGISVPDDPDEYTAEEFPHWHVYRNIQLGASMPRPDAHWRNAEVIAEVPDSQIRTIDLHGLIDAGLLVS